MQLGMIGLGRMGLNMLRRLQQNGDEVVGYSASGSKRSDVIETGGKHAENLTDLVGSLPKPRVIWLMVPAGDAVDEITQELLPLLENGDIIIDGGNSRWHDSKRRALELEDSGIEFVDVGTSGGLWGLDDGYCLMVGGREEAFGAIEPILKSLAQKDGYLHVGSSGAGHFVKMVHNGVEYGLLQAYGEGFAILKAGEFDLNFEKIADLWNHGSVIRSWLLELAILAFREDPKLERIDDYVGDSGEGRWTIKDAIDLDVPAPIITLSLFERFHSRQESSYSSKLIAALRNQFGGHKCRPSGDKCDDNPVSNA